MWIQLVLFACAPEPWSQSPLQGTAPTLEDTSSAPGDPNTQTQTTPALPRPAVDFEIPGHDGQPIRLSDHAGEVILLDMSGFT